MSIYSRCERCESLLVVQICESRPHFFLDMKVPSAYYAGNTRKEVVQSNDKFKTR